MMTKEEYELNRAILKKQYPNLEELEKEVLISPNLLKGIDIVQIENSKESISSRKHQFKRT